MNTAHPSSSLFVISVFGQLECKEMFRVLLSAGSHMSENDSTHFRIISDELWLLRSNSPDIGEKGN
jgi:hypothetical protein